MKRPLHLLIVACAFLIIGAIALWQSLNSLLYASRPAIDFFVVFALIGVGLLRGNAQARSYAVICCAVTLVFQISAIALIFLGKRAVAAETSQALLFWLYAALTITASGYALWALQSAPARGFFRSR